mgnify:CR=1 FL=1
MKFIKRYWPTLIAALAMTITAFMILGVDQVTENTPSISTDQHYKERCLWKIIEEDNKGLEVGPENVTPMECEAMTTEEKTELTGAIGTYIRNIVLP